MNYRNPLLQTQLAGQYVVGTLRGPARRRFEGLMAADAALRRTVRETEDQLLPLVRAVPPVDPPARVWRQIARRVRAMREVSPWSWGGLYLWRLLAGGFAVAALALSVVLVQPKPAATLVPAQMALLQDKTQHVALVARVAADGSVRVSPLENLSGTATNKALELWAIPPGGAPKSLGLIAANGATLVKRPQVLAGAEVLAVSLEPPGGSPTGAPTGPVLWVGKLVNV
ncbi:anti-sigma factor [Amantichitinum ursilacus]|uniref:Anti-sigma-K factor rskA n=1 Tax=Amantichitinum ursilacus TaxID=857265 RepID=A0A0N0GQ09_9NEIS|nr:anti-sigma factor [Amantichitinum ursilacus]KPC54294.1 Anti-sigma-K factor rskA [Amantichitinum ursilacus]